jgi:tetratricopeptide (TPR) repeat protein
MTQSQQRVRLNKIQREAEGYLELGLPALAIQALQRLGVPAQFAPSTLYLWGEALRAAERYVEAIPPLEQAAQAEPENMHVWLALGWCYKRTGRLDQAVEAIRRALTADPTEAVLHYNLACYLSLAGDKGKALDHLSQALNLDPDYRSLIDGESDFDPLRSDPDFQALLGIIV